MFRWLLALSAANGFLAVSLGAFAAHGLRASLSEKSLEIFATANDYHMIHSLVLMALAILVQQNPGRKILMMAGVGFLVGIFLFSGSLYLLAVTGFSALGAITPLGGVAFLFGWAALLWFSFSETLG